MNGAHDYDLLIVGGGMVGASLAIGLSGRGLRLALVDAHAPGDPAQPGYDDRAIALAYGSRRIFEGMGLWPELAAEAEPICDIHVSDRGHFGFSRLSARDEGVPALGYVATARQLGQVLQARLRACADVDWIAPAEVVAVAQDDLGAQVTLQGPDGEPRTLGCALLAAADGGRSFVRRQLDLPVRQWTYGQSAVVTNVTPERPHRGRAFERFTDSGPLALLPMSEGRCAVVWTVRDEALEHVIGLDDAAFLAALQARFGYRLGRFTRVGRRASYPLQLLRVRESVRRRVVLLGNAAHTLHPIAGQGFNLGLRDVAALVEEVLTAHRAGRDIGADEVLQAYRDWREDEQRQVALATDGLARLFSNPLLPLRLGRNLGMLAVDLLPFARHRLARRAMGLAGRQPRLARGLPPEGAGP